MNWTPAHTKLREILVQLYEDKEDARRVAKDAQIRTTRIAFNNRADTNWHAIMEEAIRQQRLDSLIDVVLTAYPDDNDLANASAGLLSSTQTENSAQPVEEGIGKVYFDVTTLHQIRILLIAAGFSNNAKIDALLGGMDPRYVASLSSEGSATTRLSNILNELNHTMKLTTGELPLETFLSNAVALTKPRTEATELDIYLKLLR